MRKQKSTNNAGAACKKLINTESNQMHHTLYDWMHMIHELESLHTPKAKAKNQQKQRQDSKGRNMWLRTNKGSL